jgi:hypothetical protein
MRMREIEPGGSVSKIISALNECFDTRSDIWFRGQPRYSYRLTPSLFRQGKAYGCRLNETEMYLEFVRRHPEQFPSHSGVAEWLMLMQHYGIPTRLLDWTTNLLVALYFCCKEDYGQDAAIFAFDPTLLLRDFSFNKLLEIQVLSSSIADFYRKIIFDSGGILDDEALINSFGIRQIKEDLSLQVRFTHITGQMPFESVAVKQQLLNTVDVGGNSVPHVYADVTRAFSNVIPLKYAHLNSRAKVQQSYFTLHGGKYYDGREFVRIEVMEDHSYLATNLVKAKIKSCDKQKLLQELKVAGIKESTLFPEMEYQAKDIREKYTDKIES